MKPKIFLSAEWRKLIMANYKIDPAILFSYLPAGTELDYRNGDCYVSLVGFMFRNTRIKGLKIPFHVDFPEVNLRFYVRYKEAGEWKRGVVFISEIVPKPAITFVANTLFNERYSTLPMKYSWRTDQSKHSVSYQWKKNNQWNRLGVMADANAVSLQKGSMEEFITEHFWGYSAITENKTGEYRVEHPRWDIYPVTDYSINCDFAALYGTAFTFLRKADPCSVFLAEGSPVKVFARQVV